MAIEKIENCNGCQLCVLICPTDVIRMDTKTNTAQIVYPDDCQICYLCDLYCRENAITITQQKAGDLTLGWGAT
ncbi:MAG: 4Fe-4S binding protein [Rhodospirillales bacterium]|jgi:NAD-dependent dihydropyrimidine dehydrogenase PreA subunit|nr:4Fe-4S binding protein [Rhodospirillales bacterium]MDP7624238.1 4Fe-4S binding protein [Rhodospirillales bacterium]HJO85454.1 4Fe-4S binding protein [Rhodospirillales bacterium]|tara:strand:+ start:84 stop:305 length:222 start_codon:yes stop_codon:yes gene_type:complete